MGKFSKIFHHIESKDLRNKHEQKRVAKIQEEKKKEDTKKYIASAMEQVKHNWRSDIDVGEELREGMTTSSVATVAVNPTGDEVLNNTPLDSADDFAPGARGDVADFYNGTVGTSIKSSGSGSGNNGGFDIGDHLAFDGEGSTGGARWMITQPIDTTQIDQIVMSIIVGNDSNGGETPDDSGEGLILYYKTPEMNDFISLDFFPDFDNYRGGDLDFDSQSLAGFVDPVIIPVGGGSPTLQNYAKYIPTYARAKDTQFLLYQFNSSGSGKDNYGVKNISYRNRTPMQVVVPLDNPEASSFIRSAPPKSTPKRRKKDVDDKLQASDDYTASRFGDEFPGREVRVGGEDPFASAKIGDDVKPSPQGKEEVKKAFSASRLKSALGKPELKPTASPEEKLANILKTTTPRQDQPTTGQDLSTFKKNAADKKTDVAVSTAARNSVRNSPEISEIIKGMTAEQQKEAIEKMYPEKAQEILDAADTNVIKLAIEQGVSAIIVDNVADITQPVIGAKTSANAFNEYNRFLGDVAKDPNTPGATYENPINMSNQIIPGDMNDLTTTINSGNYQSIVNSIRATEDKDAQKRLKGELEEMIKDTINGNFGLDNFMHNNVRVNLPHLLETGKTKLTKQYKFTYGGSTADMENATFESDPVLFGFKKIADVLGFKYDTLGDPSTILDTGTPTFNVGGVTLDPLGIVKIIPALAVTFGPAVVAKLGLTNVRLHGEDSYDAPGMFYEIDVPGKYSVDKKGNPIQSEKPSAAEQIKNTVNNILNQGKKVVSNLFSYGDEDENAPQREDFPMGRSGAKKYSDAMKLYNAAKSVVEPQLDPNQKFGMRDYGYGLSPTDLTPVASDLPVIPPSDEVAALIAAAETGGDAEIDALAKAHAKMMTKHTEAMAKAEAEGASLESLSALSVRQYLARKPLEDALEIDSPVPPMPSEPIEPQREDYPNTRSGAKQYQDAKKAFDAEQSRKEISELSNDDAQTRVFDIFDQDYDTASALYDPLYENDPVYKEYMGIYDEMEKNATPEGQELLKQQYEALEFTLQGYASEFVDTVLVQPGELNPFGYENTSNEPQTFVGKKDAPAGVYFWDKSEREQFEDVGIDLAKYDEARALLDTYADDFDYKITDYIFAQPEHIEADAEVDRTMAIYQASSNTSNSAWASYEAHADKYAGREFILPLEQAEYDRVTKRAEELYKKYEEAENKSYDDMMTMLDANTKRGEIFTKYMNKIDDAGDMVDGAKEKRIEYWDNYEQELKSKMEVIKSKINGDYDYYEDMRALDPQMEELFNRINRQFLNLYNNRDDILAEPEGTFDDDGNYIPPGFEDTIGTDEIGKPEFDPFKDELKPGLGAEDGDEVALFGNKPPNPNEKQGRGTHINIINYYQSGGMMGTKPEGWSEQDVQNYINKFYLNQQSSKPSDPRSAIAGLGGDDAAGFSFDGGTNFARANLSPSEESILRNQLNHINRTLGPAAGKKEQERLLKMYGIYFPLASGNTSNSMVAHFVPRGKNLSEVMLVKKTKLQRPKQFFKEPNQFFNVNDIKPEFPENPPPKLDPNTGMHPEYGKKAKRYGKLDPISANSMPRTGDPEIDAVVNKQKTIKRIKRMARNK